jgi:hypothetical protein
MAVTVAVSVVVVEIGDEVTDNARKVHSQMDIGPVRWS